MNSRKEVIEAPPRERRELSQVSDGDLLTQYRDSRSQEAFAQIVQRHYSMAFRTCIRILSSAQDAEDATQAAFLILARKPGLRVRETLAGWLHRVARDAAIDILRARTRRQRREEEAARMKPSEPSADEAHMREELDSAVRSLPVPLREAVILRYLEGRDQEEAARLAGCPRGTLSWRATEGLQRLRALLVRRGTVVAPAVLAGFLASEAAASAATTVAGVTGVGLAVAGGAVESTRAAVVAKSVLNTWFWTKVKVVSAAMVAATTVAATTVAVTVPRVVPKPAASELQGRTVVRDVLINPEQPDRKFGQVAQDNPVIKYQESGAFLVRFDLDQAGLSRRTKFEKATVSFFIWDPPSDKFDTKVCAFPVKTSWDEAGATWRQAADGRPWQGGKNFAFGTDTGPAGSHVIVKPEQGSDTVDPPLEYQLDVTTMVRAWLDGSSPNYGLAIAPVKDPAIDGKMGTRFQMYSSKHSRTQYTPKLTLHLAP